MYAKLYTLLVLCVCSTALAAPPAKSKSYPNYPRVPTVIEYRVDPSWPKRPERFGPNEGVLSVAVDRQDRVWCTAEKSNEPVQVYTAAGEFVRSWGRGEIVGPHSLRLDPEGNVWIADYHQHTVKKFTPEGTRLLTLGVAGKPGNDQTHFNRPTDMAVTPTGDVFVTDGYGNRRIVQFDAAGKFVKAWGDYGSEPGRFVMPHAIVVDRAGRLYMADRNSGRIQLFDQQGRFLDQWTNLIMPWGLSINSEGDLWTCGSSPHWWYREGKYLEFKDQMFLRLSADGRVRQIWTVPLGDPKNLRPGETIGAHSIAEDSQGNLYVAEVYSKRAEKFVPAGRAITK
jgi:peptidylamidoglycolate lyase